MQTRSLRLADGYQTGWTDWLTRTVLTQTTFLGQDGHLYDFRSRAWDGLGLGGDYADRPEASTAVLTTPAPVLVASAKRVQPAAADPGAVLSYTITLSNTGNAAASASLTDTLPLTYVNFLTGTLWASGGAAPVYDSGLITWSGTVSAGASVAVGFALLVSDTTPLGTYVSNTVQIADGVHQPITRTATVLVAHRAYLPAVVKE